MNKKIYGFSGMILILSTVAGFGWTGENVDGSTGTVKNSTETVKGSTETMKKSVVCEGNMTGELNDGFMNINPIKMHFKLRMDYGQAEFSADWKFVNQPKKLHTSGLGTAISTGPKSYRVFLRSKKTGIGELVKPLEVFIAEMEIAKHNVTMTMKSPDGTTANLKGQTTCKENRRK